MFRSQPVESRGKDQWMAEFSATDAAIEGVRLAGRKPGVVLAWSLAQLLFALVSGAVFVLLVGPDLLAVTRPEAAAEWQDPAKAVDLLLGSLRVDAVALLLFLPWGAVMTCAVFRALLRPEDKGLAYMKLGADEVRMMLLGLIFVALALAAMLALVVAAVIVAAIVGAGVSMLSRSGQATAGGALGLAVATAALLVFSWLAVRLSLAAPMTFAQRRLNVFGSWKLTRGQFWNLSGAYLIAAVLAIILFLIGYPVALVLAHLATGEGLGPLYQSAVRPDFGSLAGYFTVPHMVLLALQSLYAGLMIALLRAPAAAAYLALSGPAPAPKPAGPAREPTGPWG